MSHDTKAGYVNHEHSEISVVPVILSFHVDTKQDKLTESNDRRGSVQPVPSTTTTCASETDGDYETSSEGMVASKHSGIEIHEMEAKESLRDYFRKKSACLSKLTVLDRNEFPIEEKVIFDPQHEVMENRLTQKTTNIRDSLIPVRESLTKSKSLPILKNEVPSSISANFEAMGSVIKSKSSFACKRKLSMIVEKMTPLISFYPLANSNSTTNICDRQYEARRFESQTMLPVLYNTTSTAVINGKRSEELVAEVTLRETTSNYHRMERDSHRGATPTFVNDEGAANLTNDSDLVNVARNPCSSIKSVYFAPNPSNPSIVPDDSAVADPCRFKRHRRVSSGMETLLKIDYELSPLQYQYSRIIGKARALGLSNASLDFDISCHLEQEMPNAFGPSILSPSISNYFLDQASSQEATTSIRKTENRSDFADKTTSPFASFSMVGKPTLREASRTNWLYENGPSCRQEAVNFASRDLSRTLENFNDLGFPGRVGHSTSYLPTNNIHASQEETVLRERSRYECISDNSFQPHCEANTATERDARQARSVYGRTGASPSRVLRRMEYNSHHRYLEGTVENSRISNNNFAKARKQGASISGNGLDHSRQWNGSRTTCRSSSYTSKSTIVELIDNNWRVGDNEQATDKRSNEHFAILSSDQNPTTMQTMFTTCGDNRHKSASNEAERVVKDDRIFSTFGLARSEHGIGTDRQIPRVISASVCPSQIHVVSVNTEFCATVEKRYTSRAVSPIRDLRTTDVATSTTVTTMTTMTRSPSNVILAARVSSVFIREIHTSSSTEVLQSESPSEISLIDVEEREDATDNVVTSKRTFSIQRFDSRLESSSKVSDSEEDEINLIRVGCRRMQHLHQAKKELTIVPIERRKSTNVNFAVPRYVDKASKINYHAVPSSARKSRKIRSPSDSGNEMSQCRIAKPACSSDESSNEKPASRTSIRRINHDDNLYAREDHSPSTRCVMKNSRRSTCTATLKTKKAREQHELTEGAKQRIVKAIPGIRSSPEDFLCDT